MNLKKTLYFLLLFVFGLFVSCEKDPVQEEKKPFRTVLVYLAANNSLASDAYANIDQMERGLGDIDGTLLVYARLPGQAPTLYRIVKDENVGIASEVVKVYSPHNSSDPEVMQHVIADAQAAYPATSYGLVLWSHASGWIPADYGHIKLRSFGEDNQRTMDIKDLKFALPNGLDFLLFDACSMASVEVLSEIADKADYVIASPAEVVSSGMPYQSMVNDLFKPGEEAYRTIAEKYMQHYNGLNGLFRSATISVIRMDKWAGFIDLTKKTLQSAQPAYIDFHRDQLQRMDFDRFGNPLIAFDYLDFIAQNYGSSVRGELAAYLQELIPYKGATPSFNGFPIEKFSGLTCYVPHADNASVHDYYKTLFWYQAAGFNRLF